MVHLNIFVNCSLQFLLSASSPLDLVALLQLDTSVAKILATTVWPKVCVSIIVIILDIIDIVYSLIDFPPCNYVLISFLLLGHVNLVIWSQIAWNNNQALFFLNFSFLGATIKLCSLSISLSCSHGITTIKRWASLPCNIYDECAIVQGLCQLMPVLCTIPGQLLMDRS